MAEPSPNVTPPLSVKTRRWLRLARTKQGALALVAGALAILLIVDLVVLGGWSGHSNNKVAAGRHESNNGSVAGVGAGGGSTGTTTANGSVTGGGASGDGQGGGSTGQGGGTGGGPPVGSGIGPGGVPLTATDRGVTPTTIKVVFPVPNLSGVEAANPIAGAVSSENATTAINAVLDPINNAQGGINGRKIVPEIVQYDPTNAAEMTADCQKWTQVEKVFAVIDTSAWFGDNQLCITQQGHTPLISGYASVQKDLDTGAPNLWWTGVEQVATLENLVAWAQGAGLLNKSTKFGIVYADRSTDTIVRQQFGAALARAGLTPTDVETMHFDATDQSKAEAQAAIAVHNMQFKGVTVVLPLIPFTTFVVYLSNEKSQNFIPRLLLSDFDQEISASLSILGGGNNPACDTPCPPLPYDQELNGQMGTTAEVLGNSDGPKQVSANAITYGAAATDCWNGFKAYLARNPGAPPRDDGNYHGTIEATGTAMTYCQNIKLFAAAARVAGPNLTRVGFDAAMGSVARFPATLVPELTYTGHHWGPDQYRVVQLNINPPQYRCPPTQQGKPQGNCWLVVTNFRPLHVS
jgi:hypothetical protein